MSNNIESNDKFLKLEYMSMGIISLEISLKVLFIKFSIEKLSKRKINWVYIKSNLLKNVKISLFLFK